MGNGEWGMGNGEWGMGNGEWEKSALRQWQNQVRHIALTRRLGHDKISKRIHSRGKFTNILVDIE